MHQCAHAHEYLCARLKLNINLSYYCVGLCSGSYSVMSYNKLSWFVRMGAQVHGFSCVFVCACAHRRKVDHYTEHIMRTGAQAHKSNTHLCNYTQSISLLRDINMCDYMKM